jgi:ATP-binding cassette subfamily B multidrug efflux pump
VVQVLVKQRWSTLLPRLYDIESGAIRINGVNIAEVTQHNLRDSVGFVPQKAVLFTGTIRENMQYGRPRCDR